MMPKELSLQQKLRRLNKGDTFIFLSGATIPADLFERTDIQVNQLLNGGAVEFVCLVNGGIEVTL
jgi:hypothetical protein